MFGITREDLRTAGCVLVIAAVVSGAAEIKKQQAIDNENMCPGRFNLAPLEATDIRVDTNTLHLRHNGINLVGPDNLSVSLTNKSGHVVFGGKYAVRQGKLTELSQLGWQLRATKDQRISKIGTATEYSNHCINVALDN